MTGNCGRRINGRGEDRIIGLCNSTARKTFDTAYCLSQSPNLHVAGYATGSLYCKAKAGSSKRVVAAFTLDDAGWPYAMGHCERPQDLVETSEAAKVLLACSGSRAGDWLPLPPLLHPFDLVVQPDGKNQNGPLQVDYKYPDHSPREQTGVETRRICSMNDCKGTNSTKDSTSVEERATLEPQALPTEGSMDLDTGAEYVGLAETKFTKRPRPFPPGVWDHHRPIITDFYVNQGMRLKDIKSFMTDHHGFEAR